MDEIHVSAPGKVILHGEHAVVYGKVAIAASLNLRTHLHLKRNSDNVVVINLPNVNINRSWDVEEIQNKLSLPLCDPKNSVAADEDILGRLRLFAGLDKDESDTKKLAIVTFLYLYCAISGNNGTPPITVSVESELPVSAGLGSSASFSVCLAASLLQLIGQISKVNGGSWSKDELTLINSWAFCGEKILHGNPSGIDNSISTFGGAVKFQPGKLDQLTSVPKLKILLVNTGVPRSTKILVAGVREKFNKYPDIIGPILDSIQAISTHSVELLDKISHSQDTSLYNSLEELIDINQSHLASLGVSHPALQEIVTMATKHKLHAKLTGAGGGGCAFILLRPDLSPETISGIKAEFESRNLSCWETSVGSPGVSAHS